jgi:hypothetical protein
MHKPLLRGSGKALDQDAISNGELETCSVIDTNRLENVRVAIKDEELRLDREGLRAEGPGDPVLESATEIGARTSLEWRDGTCDVRLRMELARDAAQPDKSEQNHHHTAVVLH